MVSATSGHALTAPLFLKLNGRTFPITISTFPGVKLACDRFPLPRYRNDGFYVTRTDALDRFKTSPGRRFTKTEIQEMIEKGGRGNMIFSDPCFLAVVGTKLRDPQSQV
jgi:hypothetical protein